jgi:NAD(P)H-dependent FMN reductase
MRALVVSSSLDTSSRSEELARLYADLLSALGADPQFITLKEYPLPRFDNGSALLADSSYRALHDAASKADGLVLASPIYNWGCCAELKRFVEVVGTNPPGENVRSPFFDKIITFVNAAGLPQSYMAFSAMAISMMLDFRCIINPYTVYVDNAGWAGEALSDKAASRLQKSSQVMIELMQCLSKRTYHSSFQI